MNHESMIQCEQLNERMKELMGGWMDGLMSETFFFVELLLHRAARLLKHLFSQLHTSSLNNY